MKRSLWKMKMNELRDYAEELGAEKRKLYGTSKQALIIIIHDLEKTNDTINETTTEEETTMTNTNTNTKTTETKTQNNGWERIAKKNLKNAYNWRVGEIWNAVQDGDMTEEQFQNWIQTDALDDIYHEAITTLYTGDSCGGEAPKEMRFAGKDFCYKYLISLFKKDGYTVAAPEAETKKPAATKKPRAKKTSPKTVQATLLAFTGMKIAEYTAEVIKGGYRITTKSGKVMEFNKDGTQKVTDNRSNNPKFNNRLEIAGA